MYNVLYENILIFSNKKISKYKDEKFEKIIEELQKNISVYFNVYYYFLKYIGNKEKFLTNNKYQKIINILYILIWGYITIRIGINYFI